MGHTKHTCDQCGDIFNRKGHLTEHVNHIHSQCDVHFECPECERTYEYEKNCLKHIRKDHKKILVPIRREKSTETGISKKTSARATKKASIRFKLNSVHKKKVHTKKSQRNLRKMMAVINPNENRNQEPHLDQEEQLNDNDTDNASGVFVLNSESLQQTANKLLGQTNSLIEQLVEFRKCLKNAIGGVSKNTTLSEFGSGTTSSSNSSITGTTVSNYMPQNEENHSNRIVLNITQISDDVLPLLNSHEAIALPGPEFKQLIRALTQGVLTQGVLIDNPTANQSSSDMTMEP